MCDSDFNYCFIGEVNVGKSSLINALLSLKNDHPLAAEIGFVETTNAIRCFAHPVFERIKFWDIPGAGTQNHPPEDYFDNMLLYAFDHAFLISSEQFKKFDYDLAVQLVINGVTVSFIRSKTDIGIRSLM